MQPPVSPNPPPTPPSTTPFGTPLTATGPTTTGPTATGPGPDGARRRRSYAAGAAVAKERLAAERPDLDAALRAVDEHDIVVVPGCYDHCELVLDALELPFTELPADQLPAARLRPEQLLVVNCPGHLPDRAIPVVRRFVTAGGSLFTTDWALRHVIEPAFPGVLAYNQRPTGDDVVRIEIRTADNPWLAGVLDSGDDPQWWLEGSSYPITILDPDRVEVLLSSRELADRYGEAPVAVRFTHGRGEVFHMISHYYLQRTDLRTARHTQGAGTYFAEKGVSLSVPMAASIEGLSVGDVESAASSARFMANVVSAKKQRHLSGSRSAGSGGAQR